MLIFAAHPDDETIGCGGAIQKHAAEGYAVTVCIVTDGSSSQYPNDAEKARSKADECDAAMRMLGVSDVIRLELPDMKLDTVPHADLNNRLEEVVNRVKPSVIYTHSRLDLNKDHAAIAESIDVVCRPGKPFLRKVLAYEVLSSSEWSKMGMFDPNVFIDIGSYLDKKIAAFKSYKTELRPYPHPRSPEGLKILAQYRGLQAGMKAAEAFTLIQSYEI